MSHAWHITAAIGCGFLALLNLAVALKTEDATSKGGMTLIALWLVLTVFVLVLK